MLEGGGEGSPGCDNSDHDAAADQQGIKNPTDTTKINIDIFITPPIRKQLLYQWTLLGLISGEQL